MNIAVIGAGIAGLSAAYRLAPQHDVTLFEAAEQLGGHVHTADVPTPDGPLAIDLGFIVYNEHNYPHFTALLRELDVATQPTSMSFSVHAPATAATRSYEYNGNNLNGLFAQRANLVDGRFLRMLAEIVRFNRRAKELAAAQQDTAPTTETVAQFLAREWFSPFFARHYLLPMGAAIWSCPLATFERFPIKFLARFCDNHGLLNIVSRPQWRVVRGGSRRYVDALVQRFRGQVRCATPITAVRRAADKIVVQPRGQAPLEFDHAVLACHSDQALRLLTNPTPRETAVLRAVPYLANTAVLHTDTRMMPERRRAWASWNFRLAAQPDALPCVTYWMNSLQGLAARENYFVTLNAAERIDPVKVLRTVPFEHPVFTDPHPPAQLLDHERISYAGAYWGNGFHEAGLVSGLRVATALNASVGTRVAGELLPS